MDETSPRLALPLLHAGQAQKEWTHNEALVLLDALVHAAVEASDLSAPPRDPAEGACWIVGAAPDGLWDGQADALACWTAGGWRFVAPREGMRVWHRASRQEMRYLDGAWEPGTMRGARVLVDGVQVVGLRRAAIPAPAGGATVDDEARQAIGGILRALADHGLIAP